MYRKRLGKLLHERFNKNDLFILKRISEWNAQMRSQLLFKIIPLILRDSSVFLDCFAHLIDGVSVYRNLGDVLYFVCLLE